MNNEPVAWIDKNTGKPRMEGFIQTDHDIPLYAQQRPHNTVLVPCDKLAEMQAEIEALKNTIKNILLMKKAHGETACISKCDVQTPGAGGVFQIAAQSQLLCNRK